MVTIDSPLAVKPRVWEATFICVPASDQKNEGATDVLPTLATKDVDRVRIYRFPRELGRCSGKPRLLLALILGRIGVMS